jgi:hypothetical protein
MRTGPKHRAAMSVALLSSLLVSMASGPKPVSRPDSRAVSGAVQHDGSETGAPDLRPPRCTSILPSAGGSVTGPAGLARVTLRFDEAVSVPSGAVRAWLGGPSPQPIDVTVAQGATADEFSIAFEPGILSGLVTLIADYGIADLAGNALDGELNSPEGAALPSGDGLRGGQLVLRFRVLSGDVNRDGVVDGNDLGVILDSFGQFGGAGDLDGDGTVDADDLSAVLNNFTEALAPDDGSRPTVTLITPDPAQPLEGPLPQVTLTFSEPVQPERLTPRAVFLVSESGTTLAPADSASLSGDGLTATFGFATPAPECDRYRVGISPSIADVSGALLAPPASAVTLTGLTPPPSPTVDATPAVTATEFFTFSGVAPRAALVEIASPTPAGATNVPVTDGVFTTTIQLPPDQLSTISFTAISSCGVRSAPASRRISRDASPPMVFIDYPATGAQLTSDTVTVLGRVGDEFSGFNGLTVRVNGVTASVSVGGGNNGTFVATNVPIGPSGQTVLTATATDTLGNTSSKNINVTRLVPPVGSFTMTQGPGGGGDGQSARVLTALTQPLSVVVRKPDGSPLQGKLVTFDIVRSDGQLFADAALTSGGGLKQQVFTDAQGTARAYWRLGSDAGPGGNRVAVTSQDIVGSIFFSATGLPAPASRIVIGDHNNQKGETGSTLTLPLRVFVTDGDSGNGVANVPVTYRVTQGDGVFENGTDTITIPTMLTGHAEALFTLGVTPGVNLIEATFDGNPGLPATFQATGLARNPGQPTTLEGVVLDNAGRAIGGALMTLKTTVRFASGPASFTLGPKSTDAQGRFVFTAADLPPGSIDTDLPAGPAKLIADARNPVTLDGVSKPVWSFPYVGYELTIVPSTINSLPTPIYLPELDPENEVLYDGTQDVVLRIRGIDGLEFKVKAGSMTRENGSRPSPADPEILRLNQVHFDEVPMPLPDGTAFPFAWTLQPKNARFDPPIEVTLPNLAGLAPGATTTIVQWNNDTASFQAMGTGRVIADGSLIRTEPGTGITVAGWGGAAPPPTPTGEIGSECRVSSLRGEDDNTCCGDLDRQMRAAAAASRARQSIENARRELDSANSLIGGMNQGLTIYSIAEQFAGFVIRTPEDLVNAILGGSFAGVDLAPVYASRQEQYFFAGQSVDLAIANLTFARLHIEQIDREIAAIQEGGCSLPTITYDPNLPVSIDAVSLTRILRADVDRLFDRLQQHRQDLLRTRDQLEQIQSDLRDLDELIRSIGTRGAVAINGLDVDDPAYQASLALAAQIDASTNLNVEGQLEFLASAAATATEQQKATAFAGTVVKSWDGSLYTATFGGISVSVSPFLEVSGIAQADTTLRRVMLTCRIDDLDVVGQSEYVVLSESGTIVGTMAIGPPPPVLVGLSVQTSDGQSVLLPGAANSLVAVGSFSDGTTSDVTQRARGTTYSSTNPQVAAVSNDGLITTLAEGTVFITATNEGVTAVKRIDVAATTFTSTIAGVVTLPSGAPFAGASITSLPYGGSATTNTNGTYTLNLTVPAGSTAITISASATNGSTQYIGTSGSLSIAPGSITDAGVLRLAAVYNGPLFPGPAFATGTNPISVAIGDLDGDGRPDLAVANDGSDTVSVLRNLGNGAYAARVDYATGRSPSSVAIGDLDGDGRPDLAVANFSSQSVSVLRNTSVGGNITFAARMNYATGASPTSVALGDLNGDGRPDLAVANRVSNTVSVLRNTSGGGNITFAARVDYATGSNPQSVAIGDLDGDGRPDLAVANSFNGAGGNTVSVLRNTSGGGNITFAARVDYATGSNPQSVAIGDLDGDGRPDLAVANSFNGAGGNTVSVLRNTSPGAGNVNFADRVNYATGSRPLSVVMGDLDGDGRPDLALANSFNGAGGNTVSVLRNTSGGGNVTLAARVDYATGSNPLSVAMGDLDGDGRHDLAVANSLSGAVGNTVSVLRNTSGGGDITFAARVDYATGSNPYSVAIGDLDGDGRHDLAVANGNINSVSVLRNLGNGVFVARVDYPTGTGLQSVAIGDLNGDGRPDLALAGGLNTVSVLRNTSSGAGNVTFAARVDYATGTGPYSVVIGDLDGDGRPDLAVANFAGDSVSVLRNLGNGMFAVRMDYATGTRPCSVSIGDMDGDGRPDLAVANSQLFLSSGGNTVSVLRNTSSVAGNVSFAARVDYATGTSPYSVAIGDLDGDGRHDLTVANQGSNTVSVLLNTSAGAGNVDFSARMDLATGTQPSSVSIGDLDGDGRPDLAVANRASNTLSVLRNLGSGIFTARVDYATGNQPSSAAIGDLDGDGRNDLAVASNSNSVGVLRNQGGGNLLTALSLRKPSSLDLTSAVESVQPLDAAESDPMPDGFPSPREIIVGNRFSAWESSSRRITLVSESDTAAFGWLTSPNGSARPFRATIQPDGTPADPIDLGTLGGPSAMVLAVTPDGSAAVGWSDTLEGWRAPFIWTQATGMRPLKDLTDPRDLINLPQGSCEAVAIDQQSHVTVRISKPGVECAPVATVRVRLTPVQRSDIDADGTVSMNDLVRVIADFGQECLDCDVNLDGRVDIADLTEMMSRFGSSN